MGASGLMSVGVRAMMANYAALQTTGHNIANAGVEGYSRQTAELQTATGQFTGAGFFGKGADVTAVTRSHNAYLTREAATSHSISSMDAARLQGLNELESAFATGELGVGHAAGQFLNAMVDLASRPADMATRQVILARAEEAAGRFAATGEQLAVVQTNVRSSLKAAVEAINGLSEGIAEVNQKIAALKGLGQPPNDLLDERDRLIGELSTYLQVSTIPASDGTVGVFVAGGQRLVLGNEAAPLSLVPDPEDVSRSALAINDAGFKRVLAEGSLGGGSVAGWLRFQNHDLVDARAQLGQMAAGFAAAVNEQQALGLDLRDPPGAGAPVFAVGAPQVLSNKSNQRGAGGNFLAQVSLSVTDARQLVASEYELRADPAGAPGAWQLTRRADGLVRTVVDGADIDGFTISLGAPPPAATDRFLLQPVSAAAAGMRRVLDDVRGLAAASPVTASASVANTGTATVASLNTVDATVDPQRSASIRFTSNTGNYDWELRDRSSNALLSSGSAVWTAGAPITLNGFALQLNGVPRSGDSFAVIKTAFPAANNSNALALVALRDKALMGVSMQSNGQLGGGLTVTDAYALTLASVGVKVQGARTTAQVSASVASQADQAVASSSGVNLDEEAARLLAFQQSYQAAAKVLQVAQSVFDTLLDVARV